MYYLFLALLAPLVTANVTISPNLLDSGKCIAAAAAKSSQGSIVVVMCGSKAFKYTYHLLICLSAGLIVMKQKQTSCGAWTAQVIQSQRKSLMKTETHVSIPLQRQNQNFGAMVPTQYLCCSGVNLPTVRQCTGSKTQQWFYRIDGRIANAPKQGNSPQNLSPMTTHPKSQRNVWPCSTADFLWGTATSWTVKAQWSFAAAMTTI